MATSPLPLYLAAPRGVGAGVGPAIKTVPTAIPKRAAPRAGRGRTAAQWAVCRRAARRGSLWPGRPGLTAAPIENGSKDCYMCLLGNAWP